MGSDYFGKVVVDNLPFLLDGFRVTLWLSLISCLISLVLGTFIGVLRVQPLGLLRAFSSLYVEFFRNTPLLIQLFFFYHALPRAGISLSAFESALWGLSIYTAAFVAETVRAGIQSIHRGQMEAARSLGLSYVETMRYVVLPQAFTIIIPPMGNLFIALLKNTSLASTIAVAEILYQGEILEGRTFRTFEILLAVGIFYLILTLPLGYLVNLLEVRLNQSNTVVRTPIKAASPVPPGFAFFFLVPLQTLGQPINWFFRCPGVILRWTFKPLGPPLAALVIAIQDRPRLDLALKWFLYLMLIAVASYVLLPYLVTTFSTSEGRQPWLVFTDYTTWLFIWSGLLVTLQVSLVSILLSLVVGTVFALARLSRFILIRWPAIVYIEVFRALPVFLMIILVHLESSRLAAGIGISLNEAWAVIIALTIYTVAINAEIVRAGILSIDKGQTEAARSLGLTYFQMMRWIILPQALQRMIPPLVSQFITLVKDTSLGAVIGLLELLRRGEIIYRGIYGGIMNNNPIETLLVIAVIYFIVCYVLSLISLRMERKWALAR